MKIWGKVRRDNRTIANETVVVQVKSAYEVDDWGEPFSKLCHKLNLSRPVILSKHVRELEQFSLSVFLPADFIEPVDFDRFEIELF